jgi:hypothetical protein
MLTADDRPAPPRRRSLILNRAAQLRANRVR